MKSLEAMQKISSICWEAENTTRRGRDDRLAATLAETRALALLAQITKNTKLHLQTSISKQDTLRTSMIAVEKDSLIDL
jgi:hypothetical protein